MIENIKILPDGQMDAENAATYVGLPKERWLCTDGGELALSS